MIISDSIEFQLFVISNYRIANELFFSQLNRTMESTMVNDIQSLIANAEQKRPEQKTIRRSSFPDVAQKSSRLEKRREEKGTRAKSKGHKGKTGSKSRSIKKIIMPILTVLPVILIPMLALA